MFIAEIKSKTNAGLFCPLNQNLGHVHIMICNIVFMSNDPGHNKCSSPGSLFLGDLNSQVLQKIQIKDNKYDLQLGFHVT